MPLLHDLAVTAAERVACRDWLWPSPLRGCPLDALCECGASDRTNIGFCNDTLWVQEVVFSVEINVRFVPKAVIPTSDRGLVDGWQHAGREREPGFVVQH